MVKQEQIIGRQRKRERVELKLEARMFMSTVSNLQYECINTTIRYETMWRRYAINMAEMNLKDNGETIGETFQVKLDKKKWLHHQAGL